MPNSRFSNHVRYIPNFKILSGQSLCDALQHKLIEEAQEVRDSRNHQEVIAELADVLEVVDGLCKAFDISIKDVLWVKEKKYHERGGFEKGLYLKYLEMSEDNPNVIHFRSSPQKYPEINANSDND